MEDDLIARLRNLMQRGFRLAWVHEGTYREIKEIVPSADEEMAIFKDGSGYADLYNVSPDCVIVVMNPFLIR